MAAVNFDDEGGSSPQNEQWLKLVKFYEGYNALELIRAMDRIRVQKDTIEAEFKMTAAEYEYLSKTAIPEAFEREGIKNMNVEGVGLVKLTADIYASIKSGAKDKLFQWLRDSGFGDLIVDSVAPSTLKSFLKGRIKAGDEYPEEFVNVTPYSRASITKK